MAYFNELPNLEYVNRFPNTKSNNETVITKNIFKRAKLREDLAQIVSGFEYYNIGDGERPDTIAQNIYDDPELDWVIRIANNIINLNDDWPLSSNELYSHLVRKYGSEERLEEIHHYETLEVKDSYSRTVLPEGMIVDEAFYKAPEYVAITTTPSGVAFPPEFITAVPAAFSVGLGTTANTTSVVTVGVTSGGVGYDFVPTVTFSGPTTTSQAFATCTIANFTVDAVTGLDSGKGYRSNPSLTFSDPSTPVQATATCQIGTTGFEAGRVVSINVTEGGLGYGNTAPSILFSYPPLFLEGALFREKSSLEIGNDVDGMYIDTTGTYLYTTSGIGTNLVNQFTFGTPWDINTITATNSLDVSAKFSYTSGIELSPDGTKMFICGGLSGSFLVARYDLSTAWDLSTASFLYQTTVTVPGGIRFRSDGYVMWVLNTNSPDGIDEYNLSSPWNVTTKTFNANYSIEGFTNDNGIIGFSFNSTGTKLFACGLTGGNIYEFALSTAWDLSTLNYEFSLFYQDRASTISDVYLDGDLENLIMCGGSDDRLYKYELNSRATAIAVLSNSSIDSIVIQKPGFAYTEAPTITIGAPYPSVKAQATSNIISGGYVDSYTVTEAGFGYMSPPTVTVSQPPTFSTAIGIASVSDKKVVGVRIVSGGENYDAPPTITLSPEPNDEQNLFVGDIYQVGNTIWRWNGTQWEEKTTEGFKFLDSGAIKESINNKISVPVTILEHETRINEIKRLILIPRREYLSIIIKDLRDMMKYDRDAVGVVSSRLKRTYNPKLTGV